MSAKRPKGCCMDVSIGQIIEAMGAQLLSGPREELSVGRVSTDTRSIERDAVFFALEGARFDGHDFLAEAVTKGARHLVVSNAKKVASELKKTANVLVVDDTLKAYGDLAKYYRQKFKVPAVAITGSTGKTTVKELVAHLLSTRYQVLKNRGTENNLVGVPKTLLQINPAHEVLVLEMGTNYPGEIERLSSIIGPQIGVVTQIGHSHLEGLGSLEGVREEKLKLTRNLERGGILVLNGEDAMLQGVQSGVHRVLRVGFSEGCDWMAAQVWCHETGSSFRISDDLFETQLIGRHNVLNCLIALAVASSLGVEKAALQKALAAFRPVGGRMHLKCVEGIYFIDDTYNSNPTSFTAALQTLKALKIRERKGVVCGDMLELGDATEAMHRQLGALMAELLFDFVIAAGPRCAALVDEALKNGFDPSRIHHAKDSAEAGRLCRQIAGPGDRVLVKGSRSMQMEKVFECFITSSIR